MVVIRLPGHRWFGDPQPAQAFASEDLPCAWLSTAAYGSETSTKSDEKAKFTEGEAFYAPSKVNPKVTQVRYNLFGDDRFGLTNPIGNYSIDELARRLQLAAAGKPAS
jgi:hypothetical protein